MIEHDGSLSRADEAQGDSRTFNSTIFDETKSYWPDAAVITTSQAATALRKRIETQRAANPAFDMPAAQYTNAIGQTAMYLGVFGDYGEGDASRDYVEFFFGACGVGNPSLHFCLLFFFFFWLVQLYLEPRSTANFYFPAYREREAPERTGLDSPHG